MPKENVKTGNVNTQASAPAKKKGGTDKTPATKAIKVAGPSPEAVEKLKELQNHGSQAWKEKYVEDVLVQGDELSLWVLEGVCKMEGRGLEAVIMKRGIAAALKGMGHKKTAVKQAAQAAWKAVLSCIQNTDQAVAVVVTEELLKMTPQEYSWQTRSNALKALSLLCSTFPDQVASKLPLVVPNVTASLFDTKKDVADAAAEAMREVFDLTGNKDIDHVIPSLVSAAIRPAEVPECIHALAGTTFVQSVDSATLAVVVPLLSRALALKGASSTAVKRQTALIITNMSKLVDDPTQAAPFLPKLLPGLEKLADEMADPEARSVCERSVELMKKLEEKCSKTVIDWDKLNKDIHTTALFPFFNEDTIPAVVADYAAEVCLGLARRNIFAEDAWSTALEPVLDPYQDDASGRILCALDLAKKAISAVTNADNGDEDDLEEDESREVLCETVFTLAYGSKILLHNTTLKLKRGYKYGLLGPNDSGKTSLLRSLANNSLDGFPSADEMRTVFVEADIMGELSHLSCLEYIFRDPRIQACGVDRDTVATMMRKVGFSEKMLSDPVTTLSGGWRMKLALSRAMLQRADVLLLDEPTNHLDVRNVKWVKDYLKGLSNVTAIMVSHDSGLLTDVCDHIIEIDSLKLHTYRGNLTTFVKMKPEAKAYFELKSDKLKFHFPKPSPIEGVKSKGKALIKVDNVSFKYPINKINTIEKATVQISLSSRVACIGPNGAGKSTLIKVLTGEVTPTTGTVWTHPSVRLGYIAQHAFHHIEQHLQMTPNEYIRWRYAGGDDKEAVAKDTMKLTEEELKAQKTTIDWQHTNPETGEIKKSKRVIARLTGERKTNKSSKENDYEVQWKHPYDSDEHKAYIGLKKLTKYGFAKAAKKVDVRVAQRASGMFRPLTSSNVEQHFLNVGLEPEFATHSRIQALSGGQKVKVVLGAATWQQPHLMVLDEPTNYLDRESLGALAGAIREFEGGIVVISHNSDFTKALCNETWVVEKDEDGISRPDIHGDAEWMAQALATKCDDQVAITEITDQFGNVSEVKVKKTLSKKEIKVMKKKVQEKIKKGADLDEEEEEFAEEHNLWA